MFHFLLADTNAAGNSCLSRLVLQHVIAKSRSCDPVILRSNGDIFKRHDWLLVKYKAYTSVPLIPHTPIHFFYSLVFKRVSIRFPRQRVSSIQQGPSRAVLRHSRKKPKVPKSCLKPARINLHNCARIKILRSCTAAQITK